MTPRRGLRAARVSGRLWRHPALVDGAKHDGGHVVTGAPELVPAPKVYDEAGDEIERLEGGEDFLSYVR